MERKQSIVLEVPSKPEKFPSKVSFDVIFYIFYFRAPNVNFIQAYGMTESGLNFVNHSLYDNATSIGWPCASTEAKIVSVDDFQNIGLDVNVCGEVLIRGPSIMKGYLNNPKATALAMSEEWLHTGDIGMYDKNGDFYITGRLKELIKVQANQVAPAELEDILLAHPQILDAAVIGVKHEKFGEVPKAFVVRKDAKLMAKDVEECIAKRCSKFKWLVGGVEFIDTIPKSNTGKILKRVLANQ